MYENEDVIITNENECMTFDESLRYHAVVYRKATHEEEIAFHKERAYWRWQSGQEQMEGSVHERDNS